MEHLVSSVPVEHFLIKLKSGRKKTVSAELVLFHFMNFPHCSLRGGGDGRTDWWSINKKKPHGYGYGARDEGYNGYGLIRGWGLMETFRLTRKRGGALKAKETPKVEIMIQGLCEIGRNSHCLVDGRPHQVVER